LLTSSRRTSCLEPLGPVADLAAIPAARDCPLVSQRGQPLPRGLGPPKLFLAVDRATGSAAELFAALLADNGAAKIVGERTLGAGCGYVNGGNPLALPHSGLRVEAPNCVRSRRDGSNEVEGIVPDVAVSWTAEDAAKLESFGQKVLAELDSLPL
jgi:C-terminal processing protease CtpA/Prc